MKLTAKLFLATLFVASVPLAAPASLHAQPGVTESDACRQKPNATFCKDVSSGGNPIFGSDGIITTIVNLISILVGIAAVIMIIVAGMKFITSGSNPQEVTKAREMVIYALIGVIVAALAQAIVRLFLNRVFGL